MSIKKITLFFVICFFSLNAFSQTKEEYLKELQKAEQFEYGIVGFTAHESSLYETAEKFVSLCSDKELIIYLNDENPVVRCYVAYFNEWKSFYKLIADYHDDFSKEIFDMAFSDKVNKTIQKYHLEFIFCAITDSRDGFYDEYLKKLWLQYYFVDEKIVAAMEKRLNKETNPHIAIPIYKYLVSLNDKSINDYLIKTYNKNKNKYPNWALDEFNFLINSIK